jgi:hypothetical protein
MVFPLYPIFVAVVGVVVVVHTLSLTGYQKNYRIVSGIHQGK